jgi:branched-chain amino acid transport system permease protein
MRAVQKTMSLLLQALINGLVSGALLAVPAIGFTAMFAVLRFPNFSVSGIATLGAFAGYVAYGAGLQLVGSLAVAFAIAGMVGLFLDRVAHLPLVKQGALPAAIASIASGLVLENVVRLGFGNDLRGYDRPIARDMRIGEIRFSPQQLETMAIALAIMLAVFAALAFTRIGKAMRASADNPELAALKGIRPQRVAMMASFVGMGLVGVGGMLLGLDSSIDPLTGTRILLSIFAAAVLGGLGSPPGAVLGALLIGVAEEVSVLVVGSQYRAAVGFFAILIVLSLRPRGLLGERAF